MLKKFLTFAASAAVLLCAASPAYGPMIRAARAVPAEGEKIVLDGKFEEKCWQQAEWQGDWHLSGSGKLSPYPASVAFAFDKENFYVGVKVAGKIAGRQEKIDRPLRDRQGRVAGEITGQQEKIAKDSPAVWHDDNVELFVADPSNLNAYKQFVVNAFNNQWDGQDGDGYINFDFRTAVSRGENEWTAEYAIPWSVLGLEPEKTPLLRINLSHTVWIDKAANEARGGGCWSLFKKGYREPASFGFVLLVPPEKAFAGLRAEAVKRAENFRSDAQVAEAAKAVETADPGNFIAALNDLAALNEAIRLAESRKASASLKNSTKKALLAFPWDESVELEKNTTEQRILLVKLLKAKKSAALHFQMAVNEFAHDGFLLAGAKALEKVSFEVLPLRSAAGAEIPASQITVQQIRFLEPCREMWPSQYDSWSKRPLPELVESYDTPFAIGKYEIQQFRLLINSADVKPGNYSGNLKVLSDGTETLIPVICEVLPIVLPDSRKNPVNVHIFSQIPYGGASGRAFAQLYRDHYVNWVSIETPRVYLNGVLLRPPSHVKYSQTYLDGLLNHGIDFSQGEMEVDGKFGDLEERLKIFAEYGIVPVMSTRTDDLYPECFPVVIDFFKKCGIKEDGYIYKTGDEDTNLWQQPLAKRIHEVVPSVPLYIIISGNEYWDITPLQKEYKHIGFTRSGLSAPEFEPVLRKIQRENGKLYRYTNRTSWVERDCRLAGRDDLWNVMVIDKMDGYQVWTSGTTGAYFNYRIGYGGSSTKAVHEFPPEQQSTCQLVYIRKRGDFKKPLSCIRLEDLRDGVTDYLYYQLAEKALADRKDPAAAEKLAEVTAMPRKTPAQFNAIRQKLIRLILTK